MSVLYHLREWALEHVGSTRPADVKRHFDRLGCELSDETWRKFLHGPPPTIVSETWDTICCAAGEPLTTFYEIVPDRTVEPVIAAPPAAPPRPACSKWPFPPPPDPWASFAGDAQR